MTKTITGTATLYNSVYPFQTSQLVGCVNTMILPLDKDRVIKTYYDRDFNLQMVYNAATQTMKECHKHIKINLRHKESREIVYDSSSLNIVNSPLLLYIIPYDSFGTLVTDNIGSYT